MELNQINPNFTLYHGVSMQGYFFNNGSNNRDDVVPLEQIYPALLESFGIILLGYIAGKLNLLSETESKGISVFVGTFALPALIFGSLCRINMSSVNWKFLLAIFISKSIIFFGVLIVTFIVGHKNAAKAGLYAIFTTQSNDFALGTPILEAIYGVKHPDFPSYLYLFAPISLVILNPIGFVFMESGSNTDATLSKWKLVTKVVKGVVTNPIIFMTFLGIIANLIFNGNVPVFLDGFCTSLGNAFSASALFLLGLKMAGKSDKPMRGVTLIAPALMIALKTIVMPLITREIVSQLDVGVNPNDTLDWSNFGFLYGTFPTAPSVFVYASKYSLETELIANSMVACTFVSAPIMFVSARLLSVKSINPSDYINELDNFLLDLSIISCLACFWVIFVIVNSKKWSKLPFFVTLSLAFSQACGCIGAILWSLMNCTHGWKLYLQFAFFAFGVYASRINTALLALTLLLMSVKQRCFVQRLRPYVIAFGYVVPAVLVMVMLIVVKAEAIPHGDKIDPNFQYGVSQAVVSLVLILLSLITTIASVIMTHRSRGQVTVHRSLEEENDPSRYLLQDEQFVETAEPQTVRERRFRPRARTMSEAVREVDIEDLDGIAPAALSPGSAPGCSNACQARAGAGRYRCDSEHREYCSSLLESYAIPPAGEALDEQDHDENEVIKHTVLLLLLSLSMFIGIALCIWTLVMDKLSGIYIELVFLDGFLNFGQGLFSFAIFGLDAKYVLMPLQQWLRKKVYGQESLVLPPWEDLDEETKRHCQQFLKHHLSHCVETLVRDVRFRLKTHKAVFRACELVDWLIEADLVSSRQDGVKYGRHLIKGRVIRHIDNYLDFYDDNFLYTFLPQRAST